jgi:uncharacterized protein DUF6894
MLKNSNMGIRVLAALPASVIDPAPACAVPISRLGAPSPGLMPLDNPHGFVPWNAAAAREFSIQERKDMPRYFFDIKNGHRLIDPSGLECRDDTEATEQAVVIASQIALDVPAAAGIRNVAIVNSSGEKIGEVPVADDHGGRISDDQNLPLVHSPRLDPG